MEKAGGIYACLFSDGTIKVGKGVDTQKRIATHKGAGECFGIKMVDSFSLPCFKQDAAERHLIAWCKKVANQVAGREWFKGIDFSMCKNYMHQVIEVERGPHELGLAHTMSFELLEKFRVRSKEQAAYEAGRKMLVEVSNPGEVVIAAMDYAHHRCEKVRKAVELGSTAPDWYDELNVFGPWEEELFFCEGKPDSELLKALADSLEAV